MITTASPRHSRSVLCGVCQGPRPRAMQSEPSEWRSGAEPWGWSPARAAPRCATSARTVACAGSTDAARSAALAHLHCGARSLSGDEARQAASLPRHPAAGVWRSRVAKHRGAAADDQGGPRRCLPAASAHSRRSLRTGARQPQPRRPDPGLGQRVVPARSRFRARSAAGRGPAGAARVPRSALASESPISRHGPTPACHHRRWTGLCMPKLQSQWLTLKPSAASQMFHLALHCRGSLFRPSQRPARDVHASCVVHSRSYADPPQKKTSPLCGVRSRRPLEMGNGRGTRHRRQTVSRPLPQQEAPANAPLIKIAVKPGTRMVL
jgi:hypothetical protein